jgi:integrase
VWKLIKTISGLTCFNTFLVNRLQHNVETILPSLLKGEINVYEVLDSFVVNLVRGENVSKSSINVYLTIVKSYLGYHDIDIIPARFKKRVTVPQIYREDEEPLDVSDIRIILLACSNRRLKPYLLVLASGGMRAVEALAIRNRDINFSINPTKIHIRKEFAKTRVGRDIYISEEATQALKTWLSWKYDRISNPKPRGENDLVFSLRHERGNPRSLYRDMVYEFNNNLESSGQKFVDRKDDSRRHKITLHSFRRFVKTTISDSAGKDYAEWFLGHAKSPYYTNKEPQRREIYATKCMKYLTFLDYSVLEAAGHATEASLQEKAKEIQALREQMAKMEGQAQSNKEQMNKMQKDLQDIKEFELQRLKDPNYGRKKQQQELADEMKRTGKDLMTVLSEKLSIDAMISPKMMESIKKLPRTLREVVVEKLIALVKDERGYEETHPEIKKIKGLLVDVDVDTADVTSVSEEDRMCYKLIEARFNLEAAV